METRRDFIKNAALLSGAASLFGALPETIQRAFAIDPQPGTTWLDAEHVVILMQENRSFDHCYGTLQGVRGFDDPRAMTLPSERPVWLQSNAQGETYAPFRLDIHESKATWVGGLSHTWTSQVDARNGGKHDHWLEAKRPGKDYAHLPLTLGYYTRADVPFYYALADAFTICDQHFCSSLTGTMPNRLYFWSATIRGADAAMPAKVRNEEIEYDSSASWTTFPERLEEANISWKIYQNELSLDVGLSGTEEEWLSNFGDNPLEWFTQYHVKFLPAHRKQLEVLVATLPAKIAALEAKSQTPGTTEADAETVKKDLEKAKSSLKSSQEQLARWTPEAFEKLSQREKNLHEKAFCTNAGDPAYHELTTLRYQDGTSERELEIPKGDVLFQFRQDVQTGKLPAVSWLVAPETFSDHPCSAWFGAWYVSEALHILTENPELWKKTIFILTYDENDGYFDHMPPFVPPHPRRPETGATSPGVDPAMEYVTLEQELKHHAEKDSRESPIGLGYRVPLVIASPWSRGGYVCSQVFDHTSTLQLLEKFVRHKSGRPMEETNISAWRRTVCGDLTSAFRSYDGKRIELPTFVDRDPFLESIHQAKYKEAPNGYQMLGATEIAQSIHDPASAPWLPRQEPGSRPSCALPYQLYAGGAWRRDRGVLEITFAAKNEVFGKNAAGSPFRVQALRRHRPAPALALALPTSGDEWESGRNWSFAVAAGSQLKYEWPMDDFDGGIYHLRASGPNGFLREFRGGKTDPLLEVELEYQRQGNKLTGRLELRINNPGLTTCSVMIKDHSYHQPNRAEQFPAGRRQTLVLDTDASSGWYDFSLLVSGCDLYERRFAGRVETGQDGMTDPVIGRRRMT